MAKQIDLSKCTDEQLKLIDRAQNAETWASLARVIVADWGPQKMYFGAVPYVQALASIHHFSVNYAFYGAETVHSVAMYFLSNAQSWRGPVAQVVKGIIKSKLGVK